MRGYFICWHPEYGMNMVARNVAGEVPTLAECKKPALNKPGAPFAEACPQVLYAATDGRVWVLKTRGLVMYQPILLLAELP